MNLNIRINSFYSKSAVFVCTVIMVMSAFNLKKWTNPNTLIDNDVVSYYGFLPATFIYHDLTLGFTNHPPRDYRGKFWPFQAPNGGKVLKYTMGLAILYLPFFTLGHLAAGIIGEVQDGYSPSYGFFLILGTIFYVSLGLILLRKILLRWFSDATAALTVLTVFVGTNLLQYSTNDPLMSHAYLFALNIVFLYFTLQWHSAPTWKNSLYIGLTAGIIVLIRPSDIVSLLIFVLYGIYSMKSLREKLLLLKQHLLKLLFMGVCVLVVFFPQLLYWKWNTDNWFFYSYFGEKFYFSNPHIAELLFSFRKGWLIYTPIMVFSLLGLLLLKKYVKEFTLALPVFLIVNIWIISSWWCWWYGGGFSCRPLIDSYGLLAIPLAGFYNFFTGKSRWKAITTCSVVFILIGYQVYQTFQFRYNGIHFDSMTKASYKNSFLHLRPSEGFYESLKEPDYEKAMQGVDE
jgi:hypothetical protein